MFEYIVIDLVVKVWIKSWNLLLGSQTQYPYTPLLLIINSFQYMFTW